MRVVGCPCSPLAGALRAAREDVHTHPSRTIEAASVPWDPARCSDIAKRIRPTTQRIPLGPLGSDSPNLSHPQRLSVLPYDSEDTHSRSVLVEEEGYKRLAHWEDEWWYEGPREEVLWIGWPMRYQGEF